MYVAGVDIGSLASKGLIMEAEGEKIIGHTITRSRPSSQLSAEDVMVNLRDQTGLSVKQISYIVATGYGRISVPYADENISEILCHAKGVHWLLPSVRTIIDIGGQDCKGISINESGNVANFVMNDKCAAGTGRFLEVMAAALEIELEDLGKLALLSKNLVKISNICTVFAESEIISLMAQGQPKEDIAAGLCHSIATRIFKMLQSIRIKKEVCMTGGGSKNVGIVEIMKKNIGSEIVVPDEPQCTGALGAALIALDRSSKKELHNKRMIEAH